MRKPLFLGLGLVGAAMLFLEIAKRLRGSMLPPCPTCGRRDTLAKVASTGFPMGDSILWLCSCGDTRAVLINDDVPRSFIEKALARYEMKERTKRERTTDISPESEE
jgi:hypothetical protein